jgi:hypothetical protein
MTGANERNSVFVRLFLGQVNVKVYREDEKLKLKQEYQKFRSRTDLIWVFMSLIQLVIWPDVRALEIIFQIWLLYYYVSISLRENILRCERQQHPILVDHPSLFIDRSLVGDADLARWTRIQNIHQAESLHDSRAGCRADLADALSTGQYALYNHKYLFIDTYCASLYRYTCIHTDPRHHQGRLYKLVAMGKATRMDVTGTQRTHAVGLCTYMDARTYTTPIHTHLYTHYTNTSAQVVNTAALVSNSSRPRCCSCSRSCSRCSASNSTTATRCCCAWCSTA